jgi:hypothetical protein
VPPTEAAEQDVKFMESAELRLIPGSCPPTIESLSAVIAHSQIVVAQPYRNVELARRFRLRRCCRARLDCRGGSPPGSRPSGDLGRAVARDRSASRVTGQVRRVEKPPLCLPTRRDGTAAAGLTIRAPGPFRPWERFACTILSTEVVRQTGTQ